MLRQSNGSLKSLQVFKGWVKKNGLSVSINAFFFFTSISASLIHISLEREEKYICFVTGALLTTTVPHRNNNFVIFQVQSSAVFFWAVTQVKYLKLSQDYSQKQMPGSITMIVRI